MNRRIIRIASLLGALALITYGAFRLAALITAESAVFQVLQSAGFAGIVAIGIATGLNPIVPVPPATFAPLFIESGFATYTVIIGFVIGTTIADSIGFALGRWGRGYANTDFPEITRRTEEFLERHQRLVMPAACVYFAFAPFPNEAVLIPLAIAGYRYTRLVPFVLLGNIVHHTLLVLGYQNVFQALFAG